MSKPRVLAFVMAGGEGARLHPLTAGRSKPSVPFSGRYRIVDFVLSNLVNSGIYGIYLLVQYRSQPLIEHVRKAWIHNSLFAKQFVTVVPPQMVPGSDWFHGTADAVFQNLELIEQHDPELVVVFGADHIYRMDVRQMIEFHQTRKAQVTVAAIPVVLEQASSFGVMAADGDGRVRAFLEKPARPCPMANDPERAYASMGNYIFNADALVEILHEAHRRGDQDFGHHVLPRLTDTHRLYAYDFSGNRVPGVKPYEEAGYWRDVGTVDAYFDANRDCLGSEPRFDLFNPAWPIYSTSYNGPQARILSGQIENCILAPGTLVDGATMRNSVIRREVKLEAGALLEDCIIMDYVHIRRGAKLRRVIVDRYNIIDAGAAIGYDLQADMHRYHVTDSRIVVVPLGRAIRETRGYH
jgi:glucose-1-phosphate adenylyltransferase